jgi:cytochrome P450
MLHEFVSGTGNLATNPVNKYWKNARRFAQAMLSNNSLQNWDDLQINEASRLTWDLLQNPDNYQYLFERYSTVIAITTMYGKTISGTPREAEDVEAIMAINRTLERTGAPGAYLVDLLPALRYLPKFLAPFKREGERLHKYEYSYFNGLLHAAERRHDSEKPGSARSFSEFYFDNKDYWDMTEFEITYCLGTLFEGSSGTTSAGMMSFCLAMYHHPEWQAKVQQELDEVVGNERLPSFDDWPKLPMVRAAMKETLRWRPVVPGGLLFTFSDLHNTDQ